MSNDVDYNYRVFQNKKFIEKVIGKYELGTREERVHEDLRRDANTILEMTKEYFEHYYKLENILGDEENRFSMIDSITKSEYDTLLLSSNNIVDRINNEMSEFID